MTTKPNPQHKSNPKPELKAKTQSRKSEHKTVETFKEKKKSRSHEVCNQ